jgi:hypothetical protein
VRLLFQNDLLLNEEDFMLARLALKTLNIFRPTPLTIAYELNELMSTTRGNKEKRLNEIVFKANAWLGFLDHLSAQKDEQEDQEDQEDRGYTPVFAPERFGLYLNSFRTLIQYLDAEGRSDDAQNLRSSIIFRLPFDDKRARDILMLDYAETSRKASTPDERHHILVNALINMRDAETAERVAAMYWDFLDELPASTAFSVMERDFGGISEELMARTPAVQQLGPRMIRCAMKIEDIQQSLEAMYKGVFRTQGEEGLDDGLLHELFAHFEALPNLDDRVEGYWFFERVACSYDKLTDLGFEPKIAAAKKALLGKLSTPQANLALVFRLLQTNQSRAEEVLPQAFQYAADIENPRVQFKAYLDLVQPMRFGDENARRALRLAKNIVPSLPLLKQFPAALSVNNLGRVMKLEDEATLAGERAQIWALFDALPSKGIKLAVLMKSLSIHPSGGGTAASGRHGRQNSPFCAGFAGNEDPVED